MNSCLLLALSSSWFYTWISFQYTFHCCKKKLIAVLVSCMLLPEDHAGNFAADLAQMVRSPREESFLTKLRILVLLWWSIIDPNMWKLICQISDCFCGSRLQTIWFETPAIKVVTAKAIYFVALFRRSRERHWIEVIKRLALTLQEQLHLFTWRSLQSRRCNRGFGWFRRNFLNFKARLQLLLFHRHYWSKNLRFRIWTASL